MNLASLIEKLQGLPEDKQVEVVDFVDYLADRFARTAQPLSEDGSETEFSRFSLEQAMRGMEDEPDLHTPADLKERWS